jgi:putative selenate reductase molybdopterin-binding subunit
MDEHNRLNVRTSSQTPYITRQKLCFIFDFYPDTVRVFCERVGGGFGGKQEVLTEDICALVTLKTGRPAMLEFTREEAFIGATTRHPMDVQMKIGARRDGTLTAFQMRVVSNTALMAITVARRCTPPAVKRSPFTIVRTKKSTAIPSTPTWCRPERFAATE